MEFDITMVFVNGQFAETRICQWPVCRNTYLSTVSLQKHVFVNSQSTETHYLSMASLQKHVFVNGQSAETRISEWPVCINTAERQFVNLTTFEENKINPDHVN